MITVAIPYYNNEKYLEKVLELLLSSDFVSEIIIHDDFSDHQIESNDPKIKVYRNDVNLGAFKNKYLAVSKSTNEWVYLLDSDNYFFDNSLDVVKNITPKRGRYYSPSQLHLVDDGLDPKLNGKIIKYNNTHSSRFYKNNEKYKKFIQMDQCLFKVPRIMYCSEERIVFEYISCNQTILDMI